MTWEVELIGDSFDLERLAEAMPNSEPSIVKTNFGYALKSQKFEEINSDEEVRNLAENLLVYLNGICKVLLSTYQPLKISAITKILPNGSRHTSVSVRDIIIAQDALSGNIKHADGSIEIINQSDPAIQWLELASRDEQVAKVFRLLNGSPWNWVNMYRIYEIIKKDVGADGINSLGWVTEKSLKRFSHTANHPLASGDLARHGVGSGQPPPEPMVLEEAKSMIEHLLISWITYKDRQFKHVKIIP